MASSCLSFPQRVYNALKLCEEQGREDIMSWENNGAAFTVNDLQEFKRDMLPRYFNTKKYYTFTRSLYAHGFTSVRVGRQPGIYSHPSFNRNDPLGPSLMRRVSRKKKSTKVATPNSAVSSPPIAPLNTNRPFSLRTGAWRNGQQRCKSPSFLLDKTGREDDSDTMRVFGLSFHTIAAQVPTGSELLGIFDDDEGANSMGTQSQPYPNPTPSASNTNPTSFHAMSSTNTSPMSRPSER